MTFRGDERAVTVQVGAVLLLGVIVISMSVYQVTVVPAQNGEVEFNHNQRVQEDMRSVRGDVLAAATGAGTRSTAVELGTRYPSRTMFVNPQPPVGTLRTENISASNPIVINNTRAVDPGTDRYWSARENHSYWTNAIAYTPNYNQYQNPPTTTLEHSVAVNRFDNGRNVTLARQRLIDGNTITVVSTNGTIEPRQTMSASVDPAPISAAERAIPVETRGGDPLVLRLPTQLSSWYWENELLADEDNVTDVRPIAGADAVRIVLEPGQYRLRLAQVGVGTDVGDAPAQYLTVVREPDRSVTTNTSHLVTVAARDRFNNPVSNVRVAASAPAGSFEDDAVRTDENGRATFNYSTPIDSQPVSIEFQMDDGSPRYERATVDLDVESRQQGSPFGSVGEVTLGSIEPVGRNGANQATFELSNRTNADRRLNVTDARISFYYVGVDKGNRSITRMYVWSDNQSVPQSRETQLDVGDDFTELTREIPLNPDGDTPFQQTVFDVRVDPGEQIESEDFYVVNLRLSNGDTYSYFVSHPL